MAFSCLQDKVQTAWQGTLSLLQSGLELLPLQAHSSHLVQLSAPGNWPVWTMSTGSVFCAFWVSWQKPGEWKEEEVTVFSPFVLDFFPSRFDSSRISLPEVQIDWVLSYSCRSHWVLVISPSIRCHNDFLVLVPGECHHPFCVPLTLATPLWTISSSHSLYPLLITSLSCWDWLIQTISFSSVIYH